jgi:prepilin-type N-terminal cleavage/methylation domain-containing protein
VCSDRGFTLIEVLIAVGLVVLVAAGAVGATLSSRSMAVTSAAGGFDSLLDAARTIARQFPNGATIAFTTDAYGDGIVARLYQNRPNTDPLIASTIPAVEARVGLSETETSTKPPFAITIDVGGAISLIPGNVLNSSASPTPCPASGKYHLTFAYAGFQAGRDIPCRITLANTGTPTLLPVTTASPQASPTITSCLGSTCVTLPIAPSPNATCPPGYVASVPGTCASVTPTPTQTPNPPGATGTPTPACPPGYTGAPPNCVQAPPTPSPTASPTLRLIEAQAWGVFIGPHGSAVQQDGDLFTLFEDGSVALGPPSPNTVWVCASPNSVIPSGPTQPGGWPGFATPYDTSRVLSIALRYQQMWQEANDTGGDGYVSMLSDQACQ